MREKAKKVSSDSFSFKSFVFMFSGMDAKYLLWISTFLKQDSSAFLGFPFKKYQANFKSINEYVNKILT